MTNDDPLSISAPVPDDPAKPRRKYVVPEPCNRAQLVEWQIMREHEHTVNVRSS